MTITLTNDHLNIITYNDLSDKLDQIEVYLDDIASFVIQKRVQLDKIYQLYEQKKFSVNEINVNEINVFYFCLYYMIINIRNIEDTLFNTNQLLIINHFLNNKTSIEMINIEDYSYQNIFNINRLNPDDLIEQFAIGLNNVSSLLLKLKKDEHPQFPNPKIPDNPFFMININDFISQLGEELKILLSENQTQKKTKKKNQISSKNREYSIRKSFKNKKPNQSRTEKRTRF